MVRFLHVRPARRHLGVPMWREVLAVALRHQPNVQDGWFELHPVTELEVFS